MRRTLQGEFDDHRRVVGRALPAAHVARHPHRLDLVGERRADPDVVEPAALVGLGPVGRAVAPPRVELLVGRHKAAQGVDPRPRRLGAVQFLDLDRRVADDANQRLVAPDVVFERRDVEIADDDRAVGGEIFRREPCRHFVDEGELVGELVVDRRIGFVAAGRNVEIVDLQPVDAAAELRPAYDANRPCRRNRAGWTSTIGSREAMATPW